jgi:hypothetical protein
MTQTHQLLHLPSGLVTIAYVSYMTLVVCASSMYTAHVQVRAYRQQQVWQHAKVTGEEVLQVTFCCRTPAHTNNCMAQIQVSIS